MRLKVQSPLLLSVAALLAAGCRSNDPPGKFDITKAGDYVRRLDRSDSSAAKSIRDKLQSSAADLEAALKAARDAGLPVLPEDLKPVVIPASDNAAPIWQQIDAAWKRLPAGTGPNLINNPVGPGYTYGPGVIAQAEKELKDNQALLRLIHSAASKRGCEFNRNWSLGPNLMFPEYSRMRSVARILVSESYLLARTGKLDDALRTMEGGFRIARQAASDPCMIAYLVGIAIDAITLRGMENLLDMAGNDAAFARKVHRSIAANRPRIDFARALYGEVLMQTVSMQMVRNGTPKDFVGLLSSEGSDESSVPAKWNAETKKFIHKLTDAAEAYDLHVMIEEVKAARAPTVQRRAKFKEIDATLEEDSDDPTRMFSKVLFPLFGQAGDNEYKAEALTDAVTLAADVFCIPCGNGSIPRSP